MEKIIAFFMSIIMFLANLFGISIGVTPKTNVAYGSESESQKVDIYIPKKAPEEAGLLLYIHGGAWISGDKNTVASTCKSIAQNYKYVTATMNYRLITEDADFEDMLDDITACLTQIKKTAADNGVNITSCALMGASAGGHLAMLYSYKCASESPIPVKFCVSQAGPTNLADSNFYSSDVVYSPADLAACIGGVSGIENLTPENYALYSLKLAAASPLTYASSAVPTIICHGNADNIVPYSNSVSLDKALSAFGVEHVFITFENAGHDLTGDDNADSLFYTTLESWLANYFGY